MAKHIPGSRTFLVIVLAGIVIGFLIAAFFMRGGESDTGAKTEEPAAANPVAEQPSNEATPPDEMSDDGVTPPDEMSDDAMTPAENPEDSMPENPPTAAPNP